MTQRWPGMTGWLMAALLGVGCGAGGQTALTGEGRADAPIVGFADLHNHQFGEYAYQGAWYHGTTLGPEGGDGEWEGMGSCDGNERHGPQDHAMSYMNVVCAIGGAATEDACVHTDRTDGYVGPGDPDNYSGWPSPRSLAHQQNWWGHVQDAWEDGLRLMVVPAVNFRILCQLMEPANYKYFYDCEDLGAVDLQLEAAREFADIHSDWMGIAYTPADARSIIGQGRLAVVLAIEVTDIFPTGGMDNAPMAFDASGAITDRGGVLTQLRYYYDLGVRSIQLGHEMDSRFSGVAVYSDVFKLLAWIADYKAAHPGALPEIELRGGARESYGFNLDENGYNTLGLTPEGEQLVQAMMDLGMVLDISHLSRKSQLSVYELARDRSYYPIYHSHAKFTEVMVLPGEENKEKFIPDSLVDRIRVSGGMVGLRTGNEKVNTYPQSQVENSCDGSSRSFAQAYTYGAYELQVPIGFAVDFNGFATQLGPRFGEEACFEAADEQTQLSQQALQTDSGTGTIFDTMGLGHVGVLGRGLREDMVALGVDTRNVDGSAEAFVRMWERALDGGRSAPVGPPPVGEGSVLHKKLVGGSLMITSIIPGRLATVGDYTVTVSGSGASAVAQLRRGGVVLASAPYNEATTVTDQLWKNFVFGEYLTIKIGATVTDPPVPLDTADLYFFDGVKTLSLAWP